VTVRVKLLPASNVRTSGAFQDERVGAKLVEAELRERLAGGIRSNRPG